LIWIQLFWEKQIHLCLGCVSGGVTVHESSCGD
jgi:hypothetical protein